VTGADGGQIAGKVVAITGAGRGIGAATARFLAAQGARVVLGSRGEAELAAIAAAIEASGGHVACQATDVTQPQQVRALVDLATQTFGRLDVLASVAGVAINAPLHSGDLDDWNRMIDINLRGVLHGVAAALPVFRSQKSGQFITVASTAAYKWVPGQAVYAASKAAVRALCEGRGHRAADGPALAPLAPVPTWHTADPASHLAADAGEFEEGVDGRLEGTSVALDLGEEETALERGEKGDSEVVRVGSLQEVPGVVQTAQPVADGG